MPQPPDPPNAGLPDPQLPDWERRVACAEINGRRVNEAIDRGRAGDATSATFVCECGRIGCTTKLRLGLDDYERVRTDFHRFVLADGHEVPELDVVVERGPDHIVVAKDGLAGELARRHDERGEAS